jgi:hypothetical protein
VQVIEKSSVEFEVICLLCNQKYSDLEQQKEHIKSKHPFVEWRDNQIITDDEKGRDSESNATLKRKVVVVSELDFITSNNSHETYIEG